MRYLTVSVITISLSLKRITTLTRFASENNLPVMKCNKSSTQQLIRYFEIGMICLKKRKLNFYLTNTSFRFHIKNPYRN